MLEYRKNELVKGRRILELGSGCGLGGMVCAMSGAKKVVMTDLKSVIPLTRGNLARNHREIQRGGCEIEVAELEWGVTDLKHFTSQRFDLIIASEVIYENIHSDLLVDVLRKLLSNDSVRAIVSYDLRGRVGVKRFLKTIPSVFAVNKIDESLWPESIRGFPYFGVIELSKKK